MPHLPAWSVENGLCLGQLECGEKTNEITTIPKILDLQGKIQKIAWGKCNFPKILSIFEKLFRVIFCDPKP